VWVQFKLRKLESFDLTTQETTKTSFCNNQHWKPQKFTPSPTLLKSRRKTTRRPRSLFYERPSTERCTWLALCTRMGSSWSRPLSLLENSWTPRLAVTVTKTRETDFGSSKDRARWTEGKEKRARSLGCTRVEIKDWGCSRVSTEERWKKIRIKNLAGGLCACSQCVENSCGAKIWRWPIPLIFGKFRKFSEIH
jgi:hypothetical protein